MRIADANVCAGAAHSALASTEVNETLRIWAGQPQGASPAVAQDRVLLSREGTRRHRHSADPCGPCAKPETDPDEGLGSRLWLAKLIIETFTGIKIDLSQLSRIDEPPPEVEMPEGGAPGHNAEVNAAWGVAYDRNETHREEESLSYRAQGVVRTADGQEFRFGLDVQLNRTWVERNNVRFRAGDAAKVDPLVIHYGGEAASLSGGRIAFDIDSDGREESIAAPGAGSGFLVLDLNADGLVNDGRELFGPSTGEGFAELAGLDEDGNGWIDENDPAFEQLRIWNCDAGGSEIWQTLREQKVGAIYLSALQAPFDYRDASNRLLGTVRSNGFYLKEGGGAGSIQQLDFAV